MSVAAIILGIEKIIRLVQIGVASAKTVHAAIEAGKLTVKARGGVILTADQVVERIDAAIAKAGETGDAAADRIEDRQN